VGLDDLDPGNLHIRRWGKGSDVIGTKFRFRKGDLIFGRRRAYQRKLAVAEMDGICSAHAMVVRAKPDVVLPEFLPFLMMSDKFMNRAVEISVGSLSPTINWTTLKLQEFDLPLLDQQRRIAEILWEVDNTVCSWDHAEYQIQSLYDSLLNKELAASSQKWPLTNLGSLLVRIRNGLVIEQNKNHGSVPITRIETISEGSINPERVGRCNPSEAELSEYQIEIGDILFSHINSIEHIAKTALYDGNPKLLLHGMNLLLLRPHRDLVHPPWLITVLKHKATRDYFKRICKQAVNQASLNTKDVAAFPIHLPPLSTQKMTWEQCKLLLDNVSLIQQHKVLIQKVLFSLMEKIVGDNS
jgi:restriction endonuclease S subunit